MSIMSSIMAKIAEETNGKVSKHLGTRTGPFNVVNLKKFGKII